MLDIAARSLLLSLLAVFALRALRCAAPAARHRAGALAIGALAALPLLLAVVPAPLAPSATAAPFAHRTTRPFGPPAPVAVAADILSVIVPRPAPVRRRLLQAYRRLRLLPVIPHPALLRPSPLTKNVVIAIWELGTLLGAVRLLIGTLVARRLVGRSVALSGGLLNRAASEIGVHRPFALRIAQDDPALSVPMTFGWRRPVLLLPASAHDWDDERRDAVLRHELAHIRRADWLWQMIGETVRALYWWNPLVHTVVDRLCADAELAADDAVVRSGVRPSDYARHLVEIAATLRRPIVVPAVGIAMARSGDLSGRIRALLIETPGPSTISPLAVGAGIVATVAVVTTLTVCRHREPMGSQILTEPVALPSRAESGVFLSLRSGAHEVATNPNIPGYVSEPLQKFRVDGARDVADTENMRAKSGVIVETRTNAQGWSVEATAVPSHGPARPMFPLRSSAITTPDGVETGTTWWCEGLRLRDTTRFDVAFLRPQTPKADAVPVPNDPVFQEALQRADRISVGTTRAEVERLLPVQDSPANAFMTRYIHAGHVLITVPFDDFGAPTATTPWSAKNRVSGPVRVRLGTPARGRMRQVGR